MRLIGLLAIPLMLTLATPALARSDDHRNNGRGSYQNYDRDRGGDRRGQDNRWRGDGDGRGNDQGSWRGDGDNDRDWARNDRDRGGRDNWNRGDDRRGWDRDNDRWDGNRGRDDRRGWDRGRDYGGWDRPPPYVRHVPTRVIVIAPYERDYIRGYYRHNPYRYDRGFRWRPAIGSRVPYGVPCRPVPYGLARDLDYYPGYERYVVGRDIILVALATGLIVDIFFNAL